MKKYIKSFKSFIRFLVTTIASREFAFVYCLGGTIAQIAHTYYLLNTISSISGNFKTIQAVILSIFISGSLLFFVSMSNDEQTKQAKRIRRGVNIFTSMEISINLYYYSRHLIINAPEMQIYDFIFAILISVLIPYSIKLYANTIQAKDWFNEFSEKEEIDKVTLDESLEKLNEIQEKNQKQLNLQLQNIELGLDERIDLFLQNNLDKNVSKIFAENSELFLKQFESKCKNTINQNLNNIKQNNPNNPNNEQSK